jgi:hypothetical protein
MKKILAHSLFLFAATSALAAPGVSGQWKVHNTIAGNESDQECTFSQKDKEVTGSCKTEQGVAKVTGTVDNNKLTWQYQTDYNGSPLTLVYTATIDDTAKISGTVEVQPFGVSGDFTATPLK